jgi:SNF2 family DNA or RNA helicase
MNIAIIDNFIIQNSDSASRSKAVQILPKLLLQDGDLFHFSYHGSAKKPYLIRIEINQNTEIKANCSCPYDYDGICKHSIAALIYLDKNIANGTILMPFDILNPTNSITKNSMKANQIKLNNGIIEIDEIKKLIHPSSYYSSGYEINFIDKKSFQSNGKGWSGYNQNFIYDKETDILTTTCSCTKAEKLCEHRLEGLIKFVKTFRDNYFSDGYFESNVAEYLAKYGLTMKDDYNQFFDFQLTTQGIIATSKFTNIAPTTETKFYADVETELFAKLPPKEDSIENTHGIGFCIEMTKSRYTTFFPVKAKYNKTKTDFSSSFEELSLHNFYNYLDSFENDSDQNFVFKTLQITRILEKNKIYVAEMQKVMKHFIEILPDLSSKFCYAFNPKNSLTRKYLEPLTIKEAHIKIYFVLTETDFFYNLKAKISIDDKNHNINAQKLLLSPLFIIEDTVAYPITNTDLSFAIQHFSKNEETNYLKKDFKNFNQNVLIPLSKKYEIQQNIFKKSKENIDNETLEKHIYIKDLDGIYIVFEAFVKYDNQLIPVFSNEMILDHTDSEKITYINRNQSFEDNFVEEIRSFHPDFENQETAFYLNPEQLFENYWLLHSTEKMKSLGIKVFGTNELKSFKFNLNKPTISINLKSDIDWFDLEINISFGNQKVDLKELQKAFIKKSNYIPLTDGTLGIMPEDWLSKFSNYFKTGEIRKNSIQLSNYQFGIIEELYNEMESKPKFLEELYQKKLRLQNISEIETVALPKGIKANLRDYQMHGLNWLVFLHKNQLGGCLADDMGLGKTLQTISFLQYLKTVDKAKIPSLIIAPTSLIFNWMAEIEKFCPTLKIHPFVGATRASDTNNFSEFDIIISTYGSLLNDIEFLKDYKFNYIILDESQAIKNPNSKRYKAVRLLNSFNRLVLTGTPIENNTFDLYAQLNFLNPGLLGNMSHFKNNFSDAIDKEKDKDASILLSKIIAPFVLRRTKEQVAKELPDKTESVVYCEMGNEQRNVYEAFKAKYRDYLLNKIDENGVAKSQMYILEGLTKLRQICNSTALINDEADYGNYSAKLEILIENIKEKTGNHKILVFSQFVKMLQIVKTKLDEEKITYEYLDGQTKNRQENVNNFQENEDVRVFLISLKAGGVGLNLTQADYVFIIDPWWNPAVENQAIDRCYRIGQTKQVMAYRMICRNTIEEKIVSLQSKKKAVANSIISIDDEKKSFNIDEVKELFR